MACTPQTNTTLEEIARALLGVRAVVICGHVNPDGDCLGSQLALAHALRACGIEATCLLVKPDSVGLELRFLPGVDEMIPAERYTGTPDAFVAVDVPTLERLGDAAAAIHAAAPLTITVDHHANDEAVSALTYVDPDAASTTMLVWELVHLIAPTPSVEMATCAYTGLVTDTGGFRFQNTDARALESAVSMVAAGANPSEVATRVFQTRTRASLELEQRMLSRMEVDATGSFVMSWIAREDFERTGATKADAEPLVNTLRSLAGVRVACILRDEGETVRGSLRAKDDTDVAAIARALGGGGHVAAAGFTFEGPLQEARVQVADTIKQGIAAFDARVSEELKGVIADALAALPAEQAGGTPDAATSATPSIALKLAALAAKDGRSESARTASADSEDAR